MPGKSTRHTGTGRPQAEAEAAKRPRQQAAKTLGGFNTKLVTNGLEIIFYQSVIQCRFICTPVSATSKYGVLSMCIYDALKGPEVQLLRRQEDIDAGLV